MDADASGSPPFSSPPPAEIEARLQTAVEAFLAALQRGERPLREQAVAAEPELSPWLDERLRLVEFVFHAGQGAAVSGDRPMPADRARRLKCPHCGNQVQLVEPRPKEVTCVNCGSSFRVEPGTTTTYRSAAPGRTVGRFVIGELLGRGAFGEVYKAHDTQLDRPVALKIPRADTFATPEEEERFVREARSCARLVHPGIVQVHEVARDGNLPYIVSDYVEGLTLADLLTAGRPGFRDSAEILAELADALEYAHRRGVIHRDVKPSNILLSRSDDGKYRPHLTDFGLARRDEGEITITLDGQVLGTPAYMSPEQAVGDHSKVDARSDVYSLGVVLYELLTGELPFRGNKRMLLHQVLHDDPRAPRHLNDKIPRDLETICLKAMAKEPGRRYPTAADFRDDLRRFLRGDPITARRVGRAERAWRWCRRNPLPASLAAAVVVALLAGTFVSLHFARRAVAKADDEVRERDRADKKAADATAESKRADAKADEARRSAYAANMNLAQNAYEGAQITRAVELLDMYRDPSEAEPDLRGFEWYYLDRLCHGDLCTLKVDRRWPTVVARDQNGNVTSAWTKAGAPSTLAFDPNCEHVALLESAGRRMPQSVKVCEIRTGKAILSVSKELERSLFSSVAISVDGQSIAAINLQNHSITVWDARTGEEKFTTVSDVSRQGVLAANESRLVFSPDGRWIASAVWNVILGDNDNGEVIVWDAMSGKAVLTLADGDENPLTSIVFSPDSKSVAARSPSFAKIWDVATGQLTLTVRPATSGLRTDYGLAFSPNGRWIATGGIHNSVEVWDTTTGSNVRSLQGHTGFVTSVSFAPDGQRLASGSSDSTVRIWELTSAREALTLRGHTADVTNVAFATDGWRVASADADGNVKLWDSTTSHAQYNLHGHIDRAQCVAFSPDGRLIASGSADRTVTIWDVATKRMIRTLDGHPSPVLGIAFSSDSGWLAAAGDQFAKIWDLADRKEHATLSGQYGSLRQVAFSADGRRLAGVEWPAGAVYVWNLISRDVEWVHPARGKEFANCVAFSPDGERLAFSTWRELHIRDLTAEKDVLTFTTHSNLIVALVYSPDGRHIVSAGDDAIRFWDAISGQEVLKPRSFVGKADALAFAARGQRLVSRYRGTVKIWDAASGQELYTLTDRGRFAVSPDGSCIAFTSDDGVELLEGSALTADRQTHQEAHGLVRFLYATELSKERVVDRLKVMSAISEAVRRESLSLLETWPTFKNVLDLANRGIAWQGKGEFDKALADYNEAIRLDPKNGFARTCRGTLWQAKGELDKALADYNEAIRLDPKNVWALNAASWAIAIRQGADEDAYQHALSLAEAASKLEPGNGNHLNTLGVAQYRVGRFEEALATLTRSLALNTADGVPHPADVAFLAMTHQAIGKKEEANMLLEQLRELAKQPNWKDDVETQGFVREAEERVAGRAADPVKPAE